jgi:Mn2+/Fe2+ NRAMP family transporter
VPTLSRSPRSILLAVGPGIVFAGAAIGVSHLVQCTRAGAVYGLGLLWLVLLAHAAKLPALLFGPRYVAATGRSLLHAYRAQGRLTLGVFGVLTIGTMFTIQAAITVVTASLLKGVAVDPLVAAMGLGFSTPLEAMAAGTLLACTVPLLLGGYGWLDRAVKVLMVVMAVCTVTAAVTQIPSLLAADISFVPEFRPTDVAWLMFAVAFVGWMPAPLDISVWHSLWAIARRRQTGHTATRGQCEVDFCVGYALCIVLAVSFVVLGAALLYLPDVKPAPGGGAFAEQIVGLYTSALGDWARPVIALGASAVMLSTCLTVLDAIPRSLDELWRVASEPCDPGVSADGAGVPPDRQRRVYWLVLGLLVIGAMVLIGVLDARMRLLVDLATTLSFLSTPLLAFFNHRAMMSREVPDTERPGRVLRLWSVAAIWFWCAFAFAFLVVRFGPVG